MMDAVQVIAGVGTHPGRRIGGSDIAKLVGLSNYGNARNVYDRIILGEELEWSPQMERGAAVEPQLRAHGQNFLGIELEDCESDYHAHPSLPYVGAQVDDIARWSGLPVVVDYKSQSRWAKGWGALGSDDVPESIRCQVAWEMLATNRDMALLVVGFGDDAPAPQLFVMSHVVTYEVPRDEEFERYLMLVAEEFWSAHVIPRRPPDLKPLGKKKAAK